VIHILCRAVRGSLEKPFGARADESSNFTGSHKPPTVLNSRFTAFLRQR
jgi:hypothetical protein